MDQSFNERLTSRSIRWAGVLLLASFGACTRGTGPAPPAQSPAAAARHDGHAHDHSHEDVGPRGGHIVDLQSADGTTVLHAEWLHEDEENRVAVFLTDPKTNQPPGQCPDSITIQIRAGKEPRTYTLSKTDTWKGAPVTGAYELVDPTLLTALKITAEGSEPLIHVQVGQQHYQGIVAHHDHDH